MFLLAICKKNTKGEEFKWVLLGFYKEKKRKQYKKTGYSDRIARFGYAV